MSTGCSLLLKTRDALADKLHYLMHKHLFIAVDMTTHSDK